MKREYVGKVEQIAYHRNGVSGNGFHAVLFKAKDGGHKMLSIVFDEPGSVAVIDLELIPEHGVTFGQNSFRGDNFAPELRDAIRKKW